MSDLIKYDDFNDAVIGIVQIKGLPDRIVYDYEKCVEALMKNSDMSDGDAIEYLEYNYIDAHNGETTPGFVKHMSIEQIDDYADMLDG